ncbi:MAG: hypothetical protein K2X82_06600 [Gemmataceae bacterium]|nr:hypothetical protein [Gemmataceae bacterium]
MRFPTFEQVDVLRQAWTDRFVRVRPGFPEYTRFDGMVGRVVTVNLGGRALVDFADGAWYDIPAADEYLEVVPEDEAKGKYDPTANSAQKLPTRQG